MSGKRRQRQVGRARIERRQASELRIAAKWRVDIDLLPLTSEGDRRQV